MDGEHSLYCFDVHKDIPRELLVARYIGIRDKAVNRLKEKKKRQKKEKKQQPDAITLKNDMVTLY
jgi:hypothetical protein